MPVATTMGFTPMDGLMMGTRPGSIDPGILPFVRQRTNMTAQQFEQTLDEYVRPAGRFRRLLRLPRGRGCRRGRKRPANRAGNLRRSCPRDDSRTGRYTRRPRRPCLSRLASAKTRPACGKRSPEDWSASAFTSMRSGTSRAMPMLTWPRIRPRYGSWCSTRARSWSLLGKPPAWLPVDQEKPSKQGAIHAGKPAQGLRFLPVACKCGTPHAPRLEDLDP